LAAIERALLARANARHGDPLQTTDAWLRTVSKELAAAGLAEVGLIARHQADLQLLMGGALSRKEDGGNRPYGERVAVARELEERALHALLQAKERLLQQLGPFERLAEVAIRAAAEAKILRSPAGQSREQWLSEMCRRMGSHPKSAAPLARLGLSLSERELLDVMDRVFRSVFGS
jgi:hypothetical protein